MVLRACKVAAAAVEGGDEVASTRRSSPGLSRPRPAVPESRPSREDARETVREAGPGLHSTDSGQIYLLT